MPLSPARCPPTPTSASKLLPKQNSSRCVASPASLRPGLALPRPRTRRVACTSGQGGWQALYRQDVWRWNSQLSRPHSTVLRDDHAWCSPRLCWWRSAWRNPCQQDSRRRVVQPPSCIFPQTSSPYNGCCMFQALWNILPLLCERGSWNHAKAWNIRGDQFVYVLSCTPGCAHYFAWAALVLFLSATLGLCPFLPFPPSVALL